MKTLSKHFYETINNIKINQKLIDQSHMKILKLKKRTKNKEQIKKY